MRSKIYCKSRNAVLVSTVSRTKRNTNTNPKGTSHGCYEKTINYLLKKNSDNRKISTINYSTSTAPQHDDRSQISSAGVVFQSMSKMQSYTINPTSFTVSVKASTPTSITRLCIITPNIRWFPPPPLVVFQIRTETPMAFCILAMI